MRNVSEVKLLNRREEAIGAKGAREGGRKG